MAKILRALALAFGPAAVCGAGADEPIRILFLGDPGHHRPAERARQLIPALNPRGIEIAYTEDLSKLDPKTLAGFDGLIVYANIDAIAPEQEKALLDFVASGKGLIPIHCASYCFRNSDAYVAMVGAQFKSHGKGVFRTRIVRPDHPVMRGFAGFESRDETYVHHRHNAKDRTVLSLRDREPWTWVRTHGKGRVFYTAWGHDHRTWGNPGFHALIERGIRWATRKETAARQDLKPFEYREARIAFYPPGGGRRGDGDWKLMQLPVPAEESMKHVVVPEGFEVKLFASDPDIRKPVCMTWDARGRLWIAETIDYPNEIKPEGEGRDRITICEDTNGDGKADKFTIFAEKLSIPTSLTFARGGVIVHQVPHTLFLKDTDGDDKADVREVLFTGWGTFDTHAGPSNLQVGLDNWIWGIVGYSGFDGEVGGRRHRFRMGFYRFRPDGSEMEFVRSTNNNTWGIGMSEEGLIFASTANRNPSVYMPIPNRYYEQVRGWSAAQLGSIADTFHFRPITEKVRQVDHHDGYTAGAGHALYTARSYPPTYWNRTAFVNGPTGHLTGVFVLERKGADFASSNPFNLFASDDEWTAPIMAEVGPDGHVWVIDWYNYIIQHNPTPLGFKRGKGNAYETELRDKRHGRIYRVVYRKAPADEPLTLAEASPEKIVATLTHHNMLWRRHAQRLLVERGDKDVVPALRKLVRNDAVDAIGLNVGAIHALWALHGLDAIEGPEAVAALKHPSAGVRRNALLVLPRKPESLKAVLDGGLLADADAQVRLAALLTLAEMPASDRAGKAVFEMIRKEENSGDRWMPDAATSAAARHDAGFLKAVLATYRTEGTPEVRKAEPRNLILNGSFEFVSNDAPLGWRTVNYRGKAKHELAAAGRTGKRCVKISSEAGSDSSWTTLVEVKSHTRYRLSAWIRTKALTKGSGFGALLNVHQLQNPRVKTPAVTGTADWTRVETEFNTGNHRRIGINCLYGGWGQSKGAAWYDDVKLMEAGGAAVLPGRLGGIVTRITRHYASRAPVDSVVSTLSALRGAEPSLAGFVLNGLVAGWPRGTSPAFSESDRAELEKVMDAIPAGSRDRLLALADRWGAREIFARSTEAVLTSLKKRLGDAGRPAAERIDAARRLVELEDRPETLDALLSHVTPRTPPELSRGLVRAIAGSRLESAGRTLIGKWNRFTPSLQTVAVGVLLRRASWTGALLDAVEKGGIGRKVLSTQQWHQLEQHADARIAARARKLEGRPANPDLDRLIEKMKPAAARSGDAARGRELYARNCRVCHEIGGEGGRVGPSLTGIGARPKAELLAEILDPNRSVEANYQLWIVATLDGDILSGRLDAETRTTVELLDLEGKKHVVQRKDIRAMKASEKSIMPPGFEKLGVDGLGDLLEFLSRSRQKR